MKKQFKAHSASEIFPLMSAAEYAKLLADIDENGIRTSIKLIGESREDCEVLDGRNRLKAVEELGLDLWDSAELIHPDDMPDPVAYVLSLNLHRRHLTESQRAMVASKIATLKNHRPKGSGSIDLLPESKTQSSAAKQLNVSVPSVKRARKVQEQAVPNIVAAVERGEVSVSAANEVAKLPKAQQQKLIDQGPDAVKAEAARLRKAKPRKDTTKQDNPPAKTPKPKSVADKPLRELRELFDAMEGPDRIAVTRFIDWGMAQSDIAMRNGCCLWLDWTG